MARSIVIEFLGKDKNLGSTAGDIDGKMSRLGGTLKKVGKVAAIGLAAGLAVAGKAMFDMTKMAMEDEAAQAQLAKTLQNVAGATKAQVAGAEKWISAQGRALGVTDDELRPALARLATATGDVGKAQKLASLAMDVSAGSGKSLESVSTALMKAQNGQVSSLARLGINVKDAEGKTVSFTEATKRMADTFGGQAAAKADTFQGKMDRLKLIFNETREEIGARLIPIVTRLAEWFLNEGLPAVQNFGAELSARLGPILRAVGGFISGTVVPAVKGLVAQFTGAEGGANKVRGALQAAEPFFRLVWAAVKALAVVISEVLWPVVKRIAEVALPAMGAALGAVGRAGTWMWNNALQPVFKLIVGAVGHMMIKWGQMLQLLGKVPGFGWAKDAGEKMEAAGSKAVGLAEKIRKIPDSKSVKITADTTLAGRTVDQFVRDMSNRSITIPVITTSIRERVPARAHGGPVSAGRPYLVGEREPELFVPNTSGRILNQKQIAAASKATVSSSPEVRALRTELAAQRAASSRENAALLAAIDRGNDQIATLTNRIGALPKDYALASRQGAR